MVLETGVALQCSDHFGVLVAVYVAVTTVNGQLLFRLFTEQFTASMSGETRSQPPAPPDTGSSRSDTVLSDGQNNLSTVAGVSGAGVSPPINETILPPTPGSGEGSADASKFLSFGRYRKWEVRAVIFGGDDCVDLKKIYHVL